MGKGKYDHHAFRKDAIKVNSSKEEPKEEDAIPQPPLSVVMCREHLQDLIREHPEKARKVLYDAHLKFIRDNNFKQSKSTSGGDYDV